MNITHMTADALSFDKKNPRLVEQNLNKATEDKILNILWSEMAVKDLVMSIQANGFFETEPLLVVKEREENVVVEGNRRLAAIKAILHPDKIQNKGMDAFKEKSTPDLIKKLTESIPIILLQKRIDAWQYIGFKHVKGAAKWDSLAKAEYVSTVHNQYKVPLEDIANQIGDSNNIIKKLYQGLMVLKQADRLTDFKINDIYNGRLYFSHIYTAIGYSGFQKYLGLDNNNVTENQVPQDKLENLRDVMFWILGSKSQDLQPIIRSQNPDLSQLDAVLKSPEAIQVLKSTGSLPDAYDTSLDGGDVLYSSIAEAQLKIEKALSKMTYFDGVNISILEAAIHLADSADDLYKGLKNIYQKKNGIETKRSIE